MKNFNMIRSVSEPSLATTIGTRNSKTAMTIADKSHHDRRQLKAITETFRGNFFWTGKRGEVTVVLMSLPWQLWWQTFVMFTIVYKFVMHLLLAYYMEDFLNIFNLTVWISEFVFVFDVFIHMLHMFWPLVRFHVRCYRRNYFMLAFDVISMMPFSLLCSSFWEYPDGVMIGRWLGILRIYRLVLYFLLINVTVRSYRVLLFTAEHMFASALVLHASTCIWHHFHKDPKPLYPWRNTISYPKHITDGRLDYQTYLQSWYYCSCRYFNVVYGDTFPLQVKEKWLTVVLMLFGYCCARFWLIGVLTWEISFRNNRRSKFVDRYHHMVRYLRFLNAPPWLIDQAEKYRQQLWNMKDGILNSNHLKMLPLPFQMELIFDINVGHFHNTLLFRDTDEAFMRKISLLMRHELFLAGQPIWNQGVVKNGLLCIKRGVIEMLSDEDDESPMIAFKEGTVLGELSLFYSIPAKVTVKAATYVEVQVLRRTDFMRITAEHPATVQKIREKITNRLRSARARQEAIRIYEEGDSRLIRTRYRPIKVLKDYLAGVEEENPLFVDDSHLYYRDENNERKRKFTAEFLQLYQMSEKVTTIDAPRICLRATFPWILEPNTGFIFMFEVAHLLLVIYVCIFAPYFAIKDTPTHLEKILNTVVLFGLLLNIYLQLTTAIINKHDRKETVKEIAEAKMGTFGFYLDIMSVFPVYIFSDTLDPYSTSVIGQIATLFPILQVWHMWDYMTIWQRNFYSNLKFLCFLKFGLIISIFSYWAGCFMYMYACPRKLCREQSWLSQLIYWETKVFVINDAKHERPFLSSLALGIATFTGSGMSDIAPGLGDLFVIFLLFMTGAYVSFFYTSKIASIYLISTQRKLKFRESMRELFYFLSVNYVSNKIKSRVRKFFSVQWYYNSAVSSEEIFRDMSVNIRQEILAVEMVDTLQLCPLFQDCSRDFLQTVATYTRTIVLPDNEVVQHSGDIGRDMYILQKGHCNVLDNVGKIMHTPGPGANFGVIEMIFGLPKVYTVLTSTNCILLHLEFSTLVQCWSTFPDMSHPIVKAQQDHEVRQLTKQYEDTKATTGRLDAKTNRIAQEIKESFVWLNSYEQREQYMKAFEKLGVLRLIRYFFVPACITPHGIFLKIWCLFRFAIAFYYVLVVPYNIATKQHKHGAGYDVCDLFLYADVIVMSYVAYYNEKSLLVTHPLLTIKRYLSHGFLMDAICIFPFEELFRVINEKTDLDLYRINRILLVHRIMGTFSHWESDIMTVSQAMVLLKFLPVAVAIVNVVTAFVFISSCVPKLDGDVIIVNCTRVLLVSTYKYEVRKALCEYTDTFYWISEIFMQCGCTPIVVSNMMDTCLSMCLQIIGLLYFAFMFGYVASTRTATTHALLDHTEKTQDLSNFLYQNNVDPILTTKTLKYFEYVWKRTNGSNPQQICRGLNSALMEDTLVFMYERALREVPLFGKVERSFIRVITQHLTEMYFLKGETVIQCKDVQPYIYIIYRGKVDVLTTYNEMLTCMGPGGMFGNFTGQAISSSEVSIYASRSLDLLVIHSQMFFNLVRYYPKLKEPLTRALETSKDYILPISMDSILDASSTDESNDDGLSRDSAVDSRSGSSRFEVNAGQLSLRSSQSNVSQAKSAASVTTHNGVHIQHLLRPGSWMYQGYGYITCVVTTVNYVILLYEIITLNDCYIIFWVQAIFDIYFYIKCYVTMHQGYLSKRGELILDSAKCRRRYFSHKMWVWSDILVNLPMEMLALCFRYKLKLMHYLRLNKLFRLKYLVQFYRQTSAELTNNLTSLQAVMTILVVILLIHSLTCIWLVCMTGIASVVKIRTLKLHLIDEETMQRHWDFTTSIYLIVSEITTTGLDELMVSTDAFPLVVLGIALLSGKMLAAIVVATAIQVANSSKFGISMYENAVSELIDMLKNQGLSNYQLKKYYAYVRQLWITERGRQLPALLPQTPYVRRCDLMSAMFGQHLRNCYLFAETGEAFLRQLTVLLDYSVYFPGNYIVGAGDSEARMYWVASGTVSVVSVRADLTETTHELLYAGDVFGILQGLSRGVNHCFSYRAETKASILSLSLDAWVNILPFFPDAQQMIADRSEILFSQI